jgi:KaiC/GvpD/RAD55 family RecA-like ATPase
MIEGFREAPKNQNILTEGERALFEKTSSHFRTIREEMGRVEWRLGEYEKIPDSTKWDALVQEIALLDKLEILPTRLLEDLEEVRRKERQMPGWPGGSASWTR